MLSAICSKMRSIRSSDCASAPHHRELAASELAAHLQHVWICKQWAQQMHVAVQRQRVNQIVCVAVRQLHLQRVKSWVPSPLNAMKRSWQLMWCPEISCQVLCMRSKLRLPSMSGPGSCGWRCAQCPPQCTRLRSMQQLPPAGRQAWPQTAKDMLAAVGAPHQTCVDIGSVWSLHQRLIETVHGHGL
jgi:hypothetical protein